MRIFCAQLCANQCFWGGTSGFGRGEISLVPRVLFLGFHQGTIGREIRELQVTPPIGDWD